MGVRRCGRRGLSWATSWEEFRGRRIFQFVHWFAGTTRFGVGEAVVAEASKHGLRAEHISLDRDRDGVDLARRRAGRVTSYLGQRAQGGWCTRWLPVLYLFEIEVSRAARHARSSSGPRAHERPPLQHAGAAGGGGGGLAAGGFGPLPSWTPSRSSARERSVQAEATLENPLPSGPPYPSAFFVDEVAAFLQDEESEAAEFNSCINDMPNWKPARWAGALRGLASLSGRCKCKVPHEQIIGKKASAAAARYSPQHCAKCTRSSW